jgi:transmembrane sensor
MKPWKMVQSNKAISKLAAQWAAKVASGNLTAGEQENLASWLAADARHLGAYARANAALALLDRFRGIDADALRTPAPETLQDSLTSQAWTRRRLIWTGAAASLLSAGVAGALLWRARLPAEFATQLGETRVVTLSDGSVVTLNTATRISVRYTEAWRKIRIEQGEALFKVAKNRQRPFIVEAADTEVRAVGTRFAVRVLPRRSIQILVEEGVVEVACPDKPAVRTVRAIAETQAVVQAKAPIVTRAVPRAAAARSLAWQFGQIAFENEKLEDAAKEFARYSNTRIIVAPTVTDLTVTGMFPSNDPVGFAKAAAAALQIRVEVGTDGVYLVR